MRQVRVVLPKFDVRGYVRSCRQIWAREPAYFPLGESRHALSLARVPSLARIASYGSFECTAGDVQIAVERDRSQGLAVFPERGLLDANVSSLSRSWTLGFAT